MKSKGPVEHRWLGLYYNASQTTHVVAACSCGWRGTPRRPEGEHGNVKPWVEDYRQHFDKVRRDAYGPTPRPRV